MNPPTLLVVGSWIDGADFKYSRSTPIRTSSDLRSGFNLEPIWADLIADIHHGSNGWACSSPPHEHPSTQGHEHGGDPAGGNPIRRQHESMRQWTVLIEIEGAADTRKDSAPVMVKQRGPTTGNRGPWQAQCSSEQSPTHGPAIRYRSRCYAIHRGKTRTR
jgi:hypothetical protein